MSSLISSPRQQNAFALSGGKYVVRSDLIRDGRERRVFIYLRQEEIRRGVDIDASHEKTKMRLISFPLIFKIFRHFMSFLVFLFSRSASHFLTDKIFAFFSSALSFHQQKCYHVDVVLFNFYFRSRKTEGVRERETRGNWKFFIP